MDLGRPRQSRRSKMGIVKEQFIVAAKARTARDTNPLASQTSCSGREVEAPGKSDGEGNESNLETTRRFTTVATRTSTSLHGVSQSGTRTREPNPGSPGVAKLPVTWRFVTNSALDNSQIERGRPIVQLPKSGMRRLTRFIFVGRCLRGSILSVKVSAASA